MKDALLDFFTPFVLAFARIAVICFCFGLTAILAMIGIAIYCFKKFLEFIRFLSITVASAVLMLIFQLECIAKLFFPTRNRGNPSA